MRARFGLLLAVAYVLGAGMVIASPAIAWATHCDGTTADEGTEPCPTPTPTAEPTPTPTPVPSPMEVALTVEDRDRIDDLSAVTTVMLLLVAFFLPAILIASGLRR